LFQRQKIFTGNFLLTIRQNELAQLIEWRRFKLLIAKTNLRWSLLSCGFLRVLRNELRVDGGRLRQRYLFAINPLDQFEIVSLQTLTCSYVKARLQDRIDGFIELFSRLLALIVFEVELAAAEVIFSSRDDLSDPPF